MIRYLLTPLIIFATLFSGCENRNEPLRPPIGVNITFIDSVDLIVDYKIPIWDLLNESSGRIHPGTSFIKMRELCLLTEKNFPSVVRGTVIDSTKRSVKAILCRVTGTDSTSSWLEFRDIYYSLELHGLKPANAKELITSMPLLWRPTLQALWWSDCPIENYSVRSSNCRELHIFCDAVNRHELYLGGDSWWHRLAACISTPRPPFLFFCGLNNYMATLKINWPLFNGAELPTDGELRSFYSRASLDFSAGIKDGYGLDPSMEAAVFGRSCYFLAVKTPESS